jgi:hypothetical protein
MLKREGKKCWWFHLFHQRALLDTHIYTFSYICLYHLPSQRNLPFVFGKDLTILLTIFCSWRLIGLTGHAGTVSNVDHCIRLRFRVKVYTLRPLSPIVTHAIIDTCSICVPYRKTLDWSIASRRI